MAGKGAAVAGLSLLAVAIAGTGRCGAAHPGFSEKEFQPCVQRLRVLPVEQWGLFRQPAAVRIESEANRPVRVFTLRGQTVYQGKPGRLPPLPVGHYLVETTADRTQFAVLPRDYRGASFLGTDAGDWDITHQQRLELISPGWVRTGTGRWSRVQPRPGHWDWKQLDRTVELNPGRRIIAVAVDRPDWVSDAEFFDRYAEYVAAIARRYGNRIHAIEIWNEPWFDAARSYRIPGARDLDTLLQQYATLLERGARAVRAVNPRIKIFGPAWSHPYFTTETEALVRAGLLRWIDGLSFHDYFMRLTAPDRPMAEHFPRLDQRVAVWREIVQGKPLIVDEIGLYGESALGTPNRYEHRSFYSGLDWHRGMCRAIKLALMYRAGNAEVILPHVLPMHGHSGSNLEIFGWDMAADNSIHPRGPHPKTTAFLMSCYWLDNARHLTHRVIGEKLFLYAWQRPDGELLVFAWTAEGSPMRWIKAPPVPATDIFGAALSPDSLGEEPLLFRAAATTTTAERLLDSIAAALAD